MDLNKCLLSVTVLFYKPVSQRTLKVFVVQMTKYLIFPYLTVWLLKMFALCSQICLSYTRDRSSWLQVCSPSFTSRCCFKHDMDQSSLSESRYASLSRYSLARWFPFIWNNMSERSIIPTYSHETCRCFIGFPMLCLYHSKTTCFIIKYNLHCSWYVHCSVYSFLK